MNRQRFNDTLIFDPWVGEYLYSFICLSAGVVEWQPYCFIILLHHAPVKVTLVLVRYLSSLEVYFSLIYR